MAEEIIGLKIEVESNAGEQLGSLRSQIKAATQDLIAMRDKFGETSPEAAKAAQKVAELKEKMADAKQMADAFSPEKKFEAFAQTLTGVTSGFAAVQGAMGLFGTESKDLEKQLLKVQSAMALAQGLNGVLEAKDAFSNLATQIRTGVVNAFGSLRAAIASTGIGLLVIAIGALVTNWKEFVSWLEKSFPAVKQVTKFFSEFQQIASGAIDGVIAGFKTIGTVIGDIFSGEFSKAIDDAKQFGSNVATAYNKGFDEKDKEIKAEESIKKRKFEIDLAEAEGKDVLAKKLQLQRDELKLLKEGSDEYNTQLIAIATTRKQLLDKLAEQSLLKRGKQIEKEKVVIDPITGAPLDETMKANIDATMSMQTRAVAELDTAKALSEGKKEIWRLEQEEYIMMADAVSGAMMSLANLVGQQTVVGKGLAIASSTIDTFVAAAKAMKAEYPGDGITAQVLRVATTASVIANGLANVRRIASVQVPASGGSGTGASSVSTPSFSPILQPTMQTTVLNQSQLNLLGGQLMRAYVVESDITNSQHRTNRIQNAAEFGG